MKGAWGAMMYELAIAAGGALAAGALIGGIIGFKVADGRMKRLYEDVRGEVARVRSVAQEKLSTEEPDLNTLLRDLNNSVQDTFKAAAALENHEKIVTRQHEGGKEVLASSRHIIRMIDEASGNPPDELNDIDIAPAPVLTAEEVSDEADEEPKRKKSRKLRLR